MQSEAFIMPESEDLPKDVKMNQTAMENLMGHMIFRNLAQTWDKTQDCLRAIWLRGCVIPFSAFVKNPEDKPQEESRLLFGSEVWTYCANGNKSPHFNNRMFVEWEGGTSWHCIYLGSYKLRYTTSCGEGNTFLLLKESPGGTCSREGVLKFNAPSSDCEEHKEDWEKHIGNVCPGTPPIRFSGDRLTSRTCSCSQ